MREKFLVVQLVRHAESAANAGGVIKDPAEIPLSAKGEKQAYDFGQAIPKAPAQIICSPFLRARQTAAPIARRFGLSLEIWPVQEFTYLAPERCVNTTVVQRRAWVEDYWRRANPDSVDGPGAESFAQLIGRIEATLTRLAESQISGWILMVGHGQFMQALRWYIAQRPGPLTKEHLDSFRQLDHAAPIENCSGYELRRRFLSDTAKPFGWYVSSGRQL